MDNTWLDKLKDKIYYPGWSEDEKIFQADLKAYCGGKVTTHEKTHIDIIRPAF